MKANYKKSFLGSILALLLGTSCCWLSSFLFWIGGATFLTGMSGFVNEYKSIILGFGLLAFVNAGYQFWKHKRGNKKNGFSVILFLVFSTLSLFSQKVYDPGSQILGKWQIEDERAIIEIFEKNEKYFGKIVWLQNESDIEDEQKKDIENPEIEKRNDALIDLIILNNFTLDGNRFIGGTIYDPDSGGTFKCKFWLTDNSTLKVRDYCGILYKTFTWIRQD